MSDTDPPISATQTHCPHCGHAYAVTVEEAAAMAGQAFACTNCGRPFTLALDGSGLVPAAMPTAEVTYASAAHVKSNPLAIVSLVCGCILCVPFATGLGALVCGTLGLRKTRDPAVTGRGLAIAGIVLGGLNLLGWGAYFGLIFAIMIPSLNVARQTANRVSCSQNLRQIGLAILLYSNENQGQYPESFDQLLLTQDVKSAVFVCPDSHDTKASGADPQAVVKDMAKGGHLSYVYVGKGLTNQTSADTVVAYEPLSNHRTGSNVLFGDGSVQFIPMPQAAGMIKKLEAGEQPEGIRALSATAPATDDVK